MCLLVVCLLFNTFINSSPSTNYTYTHTHTHTQIYTSYINIYIYTAHTGTLATSHYHKQIGVYVCLYVWACVGVTVSFYWWFPFNSSIAWCGGGAWSIEISKLSSQTVLFWAPNTGIGSNSTLHLVQTETKRERCRPIYIAIEKYLTLSLFLFFFCFFLSSVVA